MATISWPFLLLFLPIVIFVAPENPWVLTLFPLFLIAHKVSFGRLIPSTPIDFSLLVFLITILVSLYATPDLSLSLPKVIGVLYGILIFYSVVIFATNSRTRIWIGVIIFVLAGTGVSVLALFGTRWSSKLPVLRNFVEYLPQRYLSLPGAIDGFNSNEVAGVLLWTTPIAFSLTFICLTQASQLERIMGKRGRPVALVIAVTSSIIMIAVLVLTQSRSALTGFTIAILIITILVVARYRPGWLKVVIPIFLLCIVAVVYLVMSYQTTGNSEIPINDEDLSIAFLASRKEIWSRALYGIQDFPITGMGMGTFRRVVHILYPLVIISPDTDIAHAHNHFLQTALDLGIIGLIAYLAVWLACGYMLINLWLNFKTAPYQAVVLGLVGGLIAYFVYGMTDAVALGARPGFIFWILVGLTIALYNSVRADPNLEH